MVVLKIYKSGQLVIEKQLDQDHIVIGSSEADANVILAGNASPVHASIDNRDGKYVLCDLGSEAGTYKNNDKILEAEIVPGDKITIGEFTIEFYLQEVVAPAPAETPAPAATPAPAEERRFNDDKTQPIDISGTDLASGGSYSPTPFSID